MKGITPVIAIILLLIITIAIVSIVAINFQSLTLSGAERVEKDATAASERLTKTIRIESVSGASLIIRSIGTGIVETSKLAVFIDNSLVSCTWDKTTLNQDDIGKCTLSKSCPTGSRIKITAPGNSDTENC